jgi:hypothetical protein
MVKVIRSYRYLTSKAERQARQTLWWSSYDIQWRLLSDTTGWKQSFHSANSPENASNKNALSSMRGSDKWLKLTTDTKELLENHQKTDTSLTESQQRRRINQPTKQDIEDINSRYLESHSDNIQNQPTAGTIAAVPDNLTRTNEICYCESQFLSFFPSIQPSQLEWRNQGLIFIRSKVARTAPVYSARTN